MDPVWIRYLLPDQSPLAMVHKNMAAPVRTTGLRGEVERGGQTWTKGEVQSITK